MAANLKSPSFFSSKKETSRNVELLPPSTFESHRDLGHDPWKQLSAAAQQLVKLQLENQELRTPRATPKDEPRVIIHQPPPSELPRLDLRHLDEIISRQAAEIAQVKKELHDQEASHHKALVFHDSQQSIKDMQHEQQVAALQGQLDHLNQQHANQLERTTVDYEERLQNQTAIAERLKIELKTIAEESKAEMDSLREQLTSMTHQTEQQQQLWQEKLDSCDQVMQQQIHQIKQLKTYLTQSEDLAKSSDSWKKQNEQLIGEVESLHKAKVALQNDNAMLHKRIVAINSCAEAYEQDLSKDEPLGEQKQHLLTRWRSKVYELMVQSVAADISHKAEKNQYISTIETLKRTSESVQNKTSMLQHRLSDMEAQLKMEKQKNEQLEGQVVEAEQVAVEMNKQIQVHFDNTHILATMLQCLQQQYDNLEGEFRQVLTSLGSYSKRISFASGRVEMLQGQFARREARLRLEVEESAKEIPTRDTTPEIYDKALYEKVCDELERVTQERDHLVTQMKEDTEFVCNKITQATEKSKGEVMELQSLVERLQSERDEKSHKCSNLAGKLEEAESDAQEAREELENLKSGILKQQMQLDQAIEEAKSALVLTHKEEMAELERQMNTARREHAKSVVSLRQFERQHEREKQRFAEEKQNVEQYYLDVTAKLENKVRALDKDRNLLMTTLRQEGLIGKYKSQRAKPLEGEEDDRKPTREHSQLTPRHKAEHEEPLHSVIDDLKQLTQSALEDTQDLEEPV